MEIPKVITHKNMEPLLAAVNAEPYFQIEHAKQSHPRPQWVDLTVTLEMPLGEIYKDGLTTLALIGCSKPEPMALTGKEGFDAQGLEGKVRVETTLFSALMSMRDIIPLYRGRILT